MVFISLLIVIATVYFLMKQYETRMVLIASGILMTLLSGTPMLALDTFAERMTMESPIMTICSVMGFAFVMKATKCDQHLVNLIASTLMKFEAILIPGTVFVTYAINIALPSAAGVSAAVGAILIPVLITAGIAPAMAASAVFAGTFGEMLSPGHSMNAIIADISDMSIIEVIQAHMPADLVAVFVGAISLTIVAKVLKEDKGYVGAAGITPEKTADNFEPKALFAIVPIIPLVILVLGSTVVPFLDMGVPQAMIIGSLIAIAVTRRDPQKVTKAFFNGMGNAYANIIGIIIAAGVFVSGMEAIGLISAFINILLRFNGIAKFAGTFGAMILGAVSGSGDAAGMAFSEALAPQAPMFGMEIVNLGSMAALGGALGRTMSPIAGAAIVSATIADVNPMKLAKRNAPGMILAAIAVILILG